MKCSTFAVAIASHSCGVHHFADSAFEIAAEHKIVVETMPLGTPRSLSKTVISVSQLGYAQSSESTHEHRQSTILVPP